MATSVEANVISAVCKNKDMHAVLGLDRVMFGPYADVYDFLREYYTRHRSVPDTQFIEDRFSRVKLGDTTAPTEFYVNELRSSYVSSNLRSLLALADEQLDGGDSGPNVLDVLNQKLARLSRHSVSTRDVNLMDVDAAVEHYARLKATSAINGSPGIPTGFESIDSVYTTGMAPGQSIIVMGYTGKLKSFWTALLGVNALRQGRKVMVISLEMTPEEYGDRVYTLLGAGEQNLNDLQRGDVDEDDFRQWARKNFKSQFIVPSFEGVYDVTPDLIRGKIDRYQPDLVILDYLQLMSDNSKTQNNMTQKMMNLSREVKLMAVSCGIPIVSITAVTDEEGAKRDGPPRLSQVAWSKAIEYDANLVISVHRYDKTDLVEVVARKSRHSDLFDFGFEVDVARGIWKERHDNFEAPNA